MMNLCLLWCLWPILINLFENKIYIRNTFPGNHTHQRLCGRSQNRNAVEAKIWTEWNIHIVIISFWHHVLREVYTNIMEEIFASLFIAEEIFLHWTNRHHSSLKVWKPCTWTHRIIFQESEHKSLVIIEYIWIMNNRKWKILQPLTVFFNVDMLLWEIRKTYKVLLENLNVR
jgi:hypothetical protein